jgi:ABC-type multidrug transport system ATPase subunit
VEASTVDADTRTARDGPALAPGDRRIRILGLCRSFGGVVALHPASFEVGPGGVTGLLGPNGSGKSTLLRMLLGIVRPDAGTAVLDGVALSGDGLAVRRRCTFAPGEIALFTEWKAREHLRWLLRGREREAFGRAKTLCDELALPLNLRVRAYSHGMKRQLLFVAALAPRVPLRILDEPGEGLDPNKRSAMLDLLERDAAQGATVLLSSHHLGEVDRVCERLVFLDQGRVIRAENASQVRARAARVLRLGFGPALARPEVRAALEREVAAVPGARLSVRGERALVELSDADPRACLARLASAGDLPAPQSIDYGQLSLQELYTDLYGVEAV